MRKRIVPGIIMIIGIAVMLIPKMTISAEESYIKSKGNIEGIVNFYSEDIKYLESEINKLLVECVEDVSYE